MAELSQGLSTLQSGKNTAPISPSLHQYYFGWSKLKQGKPNTSTEESRGGHGDRPARGGASALELGSLLSHHQRPVFGHSDPLEVS